MMFNPLTKELFTDDGQLIKQLHCPFKMRWDSLPTQSNDPSTRQCYHCKETIMDTKFYEEKQLVRLLKENPGTCIKVDLNQDNITVITHGILEQK